MPSDLVLRRATPAELPDVAALHVRARVAAAPAMPPMEHPPDEVTGRIAVRLRDHADVWVAAIDDRLLGYADVSDHFLDDLYVDPDAQRGGVGSALLDVVKGLCPDGFELWVFESNRPARTFYAQRGLVELEHTDGADNMERAPDLKMAWPGRDPLGFLRGRIDRIDDDLAVLLGRRAALTAAVQEHKPIGGHAGRDADREREIAERMSAHSPGLGADATARIMHAVIAESLDAWEAGRPAT